MTEWHADVTKAMQPPVCLKKSVAKLYILKYQWMCFYLRGVSWYGVKYLLAGSIGALYIPISFYYTLPLPVIQIIWARYIYMYFDIW